jgi:hypothetical protein
MRIRTGRFEELRSRGQPGHSKLVEVAATPAVVRHYRGFAFRETPSAQLPVDGASSLPLFEVDGSQAMTDPFVQIAEDARRLG